MKRLVVRPARNAYGNVSAGHFRRCLASCRRRRGKKAVGHCHPRLSDCICGNRPCMIMQNTDRARQYKGKNKKNCSYNKIIYEQFTGYCSTEMNEMQANISLHSKKIRNSAFFRIFFRNPRGNVHRLSYSMYKIARKKAPPRLPLPERSKPAEDAAAPFVFIVLVSSPRAALCVAFARFCSSLPCGVFRPLRATFFVHSVRRSSGRTQPHDPARFCNFALPLPAKSYGFPPSPKPASEGLRVENSMGCKMYKCVNTAGNMHFRRGRENADLRGSRRSFVPLRIPFGRGYVTIFGAEGGGFPVFSPIRHRDLSSLPDIFACQKGSAKDRPLIR